MSVIDYNDDDNGNASMIMVKVKMTTMMVTKTIKRRSKINMTRLH